MSHVRWQRGLRRTVVPEEHLTDVLQSLLGWLKLVTDTQLEQNEVAVVSVVDFRAELRATVRRLDRQTVLDSYSLAPTAPELEKELQSRTFVRQLDLVPSLPTYVRHGARKELG